MNLSELACHNCQGHGLDANGPSEAACRFCGAVNPVAGLICPRCDFVNQSSDTACANCRQSLTRRCPDCSTANWSGAEQCVNCGRALDAVALISTRFGVDPAARLNQQARESAALKSLEAVDSQRRMGELEAIEQRRQALLTAARRRRDGQQRLMGLGLALLVIVFIVAVVVMVAISLNAN
jgi:hypothetical protein